MFDVSSQLRSRDEHGVCTRGPDNRIWPRGEDLDELRLIGGRTALEGQELSMAATAAGMSVRWLDFASPEAQAAIIAQGPGNVRLPLVIIGRACTLQRPPFRAVSACVDALRAGDSALPADAVVLDQPLSS